MRTQLERWLPPGSFARHIGILTGGTVFAQGLAFLALPALTRLYSPIDFSLFAIYTSSLGIITTVASGRYNLAITMPKDDEDALAVLCIAFLCILATTAFLLVIILFISVLFSSDISAYLIKVRADSKWEGDTYLWLLPIGVLAYGFYDAIQYWTSRKKRFNAITRTRITRAVGGVATQLGWGAISSGPLGLVAGHIISGALGIVPLMRDLFLQDRALLKTLSWKSCKRQAHKFRRFPTLSVPEALLNVAGLHIPIIFIGMLNPGPEAGQLMLAMTVIGAPMALIGSSVSQVYISEAPHRLRDGTLTEFTRNTMWTLFKYSAPILLAVGIASSLIFPLIFGHEWTRAGWLVLWMTPWFIAQFVASPLSTVLVVTNRMTLALGLQGAGLLIRVGALFYATYAIPVYATEIYAVSGLLFYGLYCLTIYIAANEKLF